MIAHAIRVLVIALVSASLVQAQREWTTSGFDAQRSGWVRSDPRLTKDAVRNGEFGFLWKMKIEGERRQLDSLTAPVLLDRLIGYRGFKSLAFFGGADDRVFAVDTDLARSYWMVLLNYSAATGGRPVATPDCPGGLVATPGRRTVLAPAPVTIAGGGGGGSRSGSAVGESGRGAAVLSQKPAPRQGGAAGRGAAPATPGGRSVPPVPFGGVDPVFAVGSDGFIHTLLASNGSDAEPPVPFVPPDSRPSSLLWVDGIVYTTTSRGCGGAPNAIWAMDLTRPPKERKPIAWKSGGAEIAGPSGVALGSDGTLYVALGSAASGTPAAVPPSGAPSAPVADAIVALDRETLRVKDWLSAPGADFNATPTVFRHKDGDLVAATANDGRMYLLEAASLGGADHRTPLATRRFTAAGAGGGLATFEDQGRRYLVATAAGEGPEMPQVATNGPTPNGRLVAFTIADDGGKVSIAPAWQSRALISPLAPIVVNGMVLAVSSGEHRAAATPTSAARRAKLSVPAVLYVLDGTTGKMLWSSGTTITSFARAGLAAGGGQVYVVTYDHHLYAFGIPMEH